MTETFIVRLNAWDGTESPTGEADKSNYAWGLTNEATGRSLSETQRVGKFLLPPATADENDWRHPDVGWGVILPVTPGFDDKALARGEDVPILAPLLQSRGKSIFRWAPEMQNGYLRRYYEDGRPMVELSVAASEAGIGDLKIPRYLLICAQPDQIPWQTQYILNQTNYTGRLALNDAALANYVSWLIKDWQDAEADSSAPLVWTVDHGEPDISWLMRLIVAEPVWQEYSKDSDLKKGAQKLDAENATAGNLIAKLASMKPGLVVTTSHGATPAGAPVDQVKQELGLPVDVQHALLRPEDVLAQWNPDGAIWYAHACCSAGSSDKTRYDKLFRPGDRVGDLLRGISSKAGAMVSPLPTALLSAKKPLRAWIGHVEPTFDWTILDPQNNQVLTSALVSALYNTLYQAVTDDKPKCTIGFALKSTYDQVGQFLGLWAEAIGRVNNGDLSAATMAQYRLLVAMDRQNRVILGDPTVALSRKGLP